MVINGINHKQYRIVRKLFTEFEHNTTIITNLILNTLNENFHPNLIPPNVLNETRTFILPENVTNNLKKLQVIQ